jgi:hypothetical protein
MRPLPGYDSIQSKTVRITPKTAEKKPLSTAQKQFNSLTKKIDLQKKLLVEWKETIPLYHQHVEQQAINVNAEKRYSGIAGEYRDRSKRVGNL